MQFNKAHSHDAFAIANLHKIGIPTGFLSKQSIDFLESLYLYLIKYEIVYVAKESSKIIAFITVSVNTTNLYSKFLKSNYKLLIKFTLKNIFSIEFIKKAYETLNAPKKTHIKEAPIELPELLSIVVEDTYTKKGIGKKLLVHVEQELFSLNQKKYKVLVGASLKANQFYKKNGFEIVKKVEIHKGALSYIYTKELTETHNGIKNNGI